MAGIAVRLTAREDSVDVVEWLAAVHGARRTRLRDHTFTDVCMRGWRPGMATFVTRQYTLPTVKAAYDFETAMCRLRGVHATVLS